jgi:hypothetical protein
MCIRFRGNVLPGRCLATDLLLRTIGGDTHTDTQRARWSHKPTFTFSLFSLFWKHKSGLMRSPYRLSVYPSVSVHLSIYPLLILLGLWGIWHYFAMSLCITRP